MIRKPDDLEYKDQSEPNYMKSTVSIKKYKYELEEPKFKK